MEIKLYNSLSKTIETFKPVDKNLVRMYSCGPTVYNYAHIGNMRAFLFADLLQRVLRVVGNYQVRWVMNITNIDDKTIRDSKLGSNFWLKEMGTQTENPHENLRMLTEFYEKGFLEDISLLGINLKHLYSMPKATEYINQMQELIRKIVDNGFAYVSAGSVYFNVSEWRKGNTYGRLFNLDFDNLKAGTRIDTDQYEREQVNDFVLWKAKKEDEPYWDFDLNGESLPGRPGWHIECSAMEKELLGLPFDIHTGGIDLKFPHHEDEIAQSHSGYGIDPTVFWCHNEFLEVEGRKMAKSFNNFFTLRDLISKGIDPLDVRFAMFSTHYASTYNFTFDGIKGQRKARYRVQEFIYELFEESTGSIHANIDELKNNIFSELANDLHTPKALANLFSFINNYEAKNLSNESKQKLIELFKSLNDIFEIWTLEKKKEENKQIPQDIYELAQQ